MPESEAQEVQKFYGSSTILESGKRYRINRVVLEPGRRIMAQLHYHRSEHWIVVTGTIRVECDEKVVLVHEGQSTFVPRCTRHRVENPGKVPAVVIEVQSGEYLNEEDVVRFPEVGELNPGDNPLSHP
ncbi:phosphomannose isomerase type II C-terminal cupin domain [Candidatus Cyanaurora vandensis]|uniref:phosphomannose isomerase type II C-terminal cupin domain n=1 Tax=Candidatus Cyanaurora vandensis TaxID=2714958 RepID=UPI00257ACE08|nr:phosphomannose isomerase type II C-terminal cupin domain [Candidatus Cyanaurora vandensis]